MADKQYSWTPDVRKQRILKAASESPEYQQLSNYLISRRAMPEMNMSAALGEGTNGEFAYPGLFVKDVPDRGKLSINWRIPEDGATRTLTHEMTHAAHRQWGEQYLEISRKIRNAPDTVTPDERRLYDAYSKFYGDGAYGVDALKALAPAWGKEEDAYRASNDEIRPFGVGNMQQQNTPTRSAPPHVDATAATEAMILNELATRVQAPNYNRMRTR